MMVRKALDALLQDVRFGMRGLSRAPAFALTAMITLALGIGATTAIFSVVNAALLKPPPYPESNRLFVLLAHQDFRNQTGQMFHYIRDRVRAFESVAADFRPTGWNLVSGVHAEYVTGVAVSRGYFDVIGVRPLIGRGFTTVEDQPRGPRAVVLNDALWRRLFNGRREAIGQVVQLGGVPHAVVGIMPPDFQPIPAADLWTPLQVSNQNNSWNYSVIGRLRVGASEAEAARDLDALRSTLRRDVRDVSEEHARTLRWMSYQRSLGLSNRDELVLLFGAVSFLLLIACVNVAGLQLVRAVARRREMATRAALGSGRMRLARQVIIESMVLSLGGAVLGLLAAQWGLSALLAFVPEGLLGAHAVSLDGRVLGFTLAVSMGAGVLFGLAPALGAARLNLRAALWAGVRDTAGRHSMGLRRIFTVIQVALAVVLLVGAGLLFRSFVKLRNVELGFDPANTVIGKMSLQGSTNQTDVATFVERTLADLRKSPGIAAAAVGNNIPVERGLNLAIEPPPGGIVNRRLVVDWRYVTADYFTVFRIPLRDGRAFDDRDTAKGVPVAIVNEAFARTFFGRPQVVGELVQIYGDSPRQIVAVVGDVKSRSGAGLTPGGLNALAAPAPPTMYVPLAQVETRNLQSFLRSSPVSWAVRTRGASPSVTSAIQQTVQAAAPQLPFLRFETMEQVIAKDLETQRFLMTLLAVFAAAAMILAAIGMYGLTAYTVTQRTQEVGIRMALGATSTRVLRTFVSEGLSLAAIGLAVGLASALLVTRLLASMVFDVTPHDPITFAAVGVVLLGVSGLATLFPSVKASRTDPVRVMRTE